MRRPSRMVVIVLACLCAGSLAVACEEPATVGRSVPPAGRDGPGGPPPPPAEGEADPAAAAEVDAGIAMPEYRDEAFVEAETNRDPFRSYARFFVQRTDPERVQREVVMADTSVEEMQLIAVVTGIADARAMFLDRTGRGHTVRRGDFIGRPEVVQVGGAEGTQATLNWRVDRITCTRPSAGRGRAALGEEPSCEVILSREDPSAPNRPPLTRVVPLHDAE